MPQREKRNATIGMWIAGTLIVAGIIVALATGQPFGLIALLL